MQPLMNMDQRRLAAIVITDIIGYTALTRRDESLALSLLEEHRALCRDRFKKYHGQEIKTMGDAFLVEFSTASDAVGCAIEIQTALKTRNDACAPERRIYLRIGIHVGEVVHRHGDIFGDAVNVASRLEPLAEPGGICISAQVYDQAQGVGHPILPLGKRALKNIQDPMDIYKIVLPGSGELDNPLAVPKEIRSIAVLPFANLSADEENEYFSDGLTDDIIAQLARIRDLKVISRASAMQYKNTTKNLRQIGQELGVTTILEGSVRKAGKRVRISAHLSNAQTDEQLWAETYDRQLDDIFGIQIEVAQQIATALKAQISKAEKKRIERTPTANLEAYNLYLKGRYHWGQRTEDALHKSIGFFEQAIEKDPKYAQAYAGLAEVYNTLGDWMVISPTQAYDKAKKAAKKALRIDGFSARAITSLAHVSHQYDWDWSGALQQYERALTLNPGHATARHWHAECLAAMGRLTEALDQIKRAQELDPFSRQINASFGLILYFIGQYDQAIEQYQRALEVDPKYFATPLFMGTSYLQMGMLQEASVQLERALALSGQSPLILGWLGHVRARQGQRGPAQEVLATLQAMSARRYVTPFAHALVHWGLDDDAALFHWLEAAYEDRSFWLVYLLHVDPLFADLRADPRCQHLLEKMGLLSVESTPV